MKLQNKKISRLILLALMVFGFGFSLAASWSVSPFGQKAYAAPKTQASAAKDTADCDDPAGINKNNCQIIEYLMVGINVLSAIVGIVVIGSIIVGGIQYTSAADDPQKVAAAKGRIYNAILALLAFIFGYAFLQWIVPGGVLN